MEERKSIQRGAGKPRGRTLSTLTALAIVAVVVAAGSVTGTWLALRSSAGGGQERTPTIIIDGSSTVYPITAAWAETLNAVTDDVEYVVSFSGTGAGFEKFCRGDTHLSDASRPIKAEELQACRDHGIEPLEFQVAFDGLSVVVNDEASWVDALTVRELCRIWTDSDAGDACEGAGPQVNRWVELDASWPDEEIRLFGPGTDSGTFDYFVEVILEEFDEGIRDDFTPSEDDNILVQGVDTDLYAISYFGYAYAIQNPDKLKILAIDDEDPDNGEGPVAPTPETIEGGEYAPLSRPVFVYGDASGDGTLRRAVVREFLRFGLGPVGQDIIGNVGYVGLSESTLLAQLDKLPPAP